MAAVAMILQRDVAVADEYVKGGHATVSTAGFTIVAPARKALLHVNDCTHFKRLLPVQTGQEKGQHWVADTSAGSEY
jgi:hypothetical protein